MNSISKRPLLLLALSFVATHGSVRHTLASGGDIVPGARYPSARGAALGDAMIGLADDAHGGLFYNPAALARIREFTFEPLHIQTQFNQDLMGSTGANTYNFPNLSKYASSLRDSPGSTPGGNLALFPNVSFRGFGAGVLYQVRVRATSDGTTLRYRSNVQLIPTAGFGVRLASGVLRLGYAVQWVNQSSGEVSVPDGTTPIDYSYFLKEGSGISHNLGMTVTLPYTYQPSLQLVARNVGGLKLTGKSINPVAVEGTGTPPEEKMSVDTGFSFLNKLGGNNSVQTAAVYRDATNTSKVSMPIRLGIGVEFNFGEKFFLRGGMSSLYPSAGLGVKVRNRLSFDFSYFSEDYGTPEQRDKDTRYVIQLRLNAF